MKIIRGIGIGICVLALAFILLFNVNNVMYKTNNERINVFGYKMMTIDNKYDYYLVKETKINDVILYDNVSYRIDDDLYSSDSVKGKINDCLKLKKDDTVVCENNLEGKVVMKISGARDLLLANKGSIIVIIICIILLILVFLWKPKKKEDNLKIDNKKEKEVKKDKVVEVNTEPFDKNENNNVEKEPTVIVDTSPFTERDIPSNNENIVENNPIKEEVPSNNEIVENTPINEEIPSNNESVIVDTSPFKEEIKEDVELPKEEEKEEIKEEENYKVDNTLGLQENIKDESSITPFDTTEINNDLDERMVTNEDLNEIDNVEKYEAVPNEEVVEEPLVEENVETEEPNLEEKPVVNIFDNNSETINPIDNIETNIFENSEEISDNQGELVEVDPGEITEEVNYSNNENSVVDKIVVPVFSSEEKEEENVNINNSVEIELDDIEVENSDKIKVTPIYSSEQDFNEDVEVL